MDVKDIISSGLLELYIAGLASDDEAKQVEAWAAQYPEVKAELDAIQQSLEDYASAYAVTPSAHVKERILATIAAEGAVPEPVRSQHISTDKPQAIVRSLNNVWRIAAAACFILFLLTAASTYILYHKYEKAQSSLASTQQQLNEQRQLAANMSTDMNVIKDKNAVPIVLNTTNPAQDAVAKIYWMKNTSGEVYVDPANLPQTPEGKQYQLWAIVNGEPVDAGMISTDKGAVYRIQKMKSFGNVQVQAFAITLEKAGGSPTPTMDKMVVVSKI